MRVYQSSNSVSPLLPPSPLPPQQTTAAVQRRCCPLVATIKNYQTKTLFIHPSCGIWKSNHCQAPCHNPVSHYGSAAPRLVVATVHRYISKHQPQRHQQKQQAEPCTTGVAAAMQGGWSGKVRIMWLIQL